MPRYYSSGYKKSQKRSEKSGRFWVWATVILFLLFIGTIFYFTKVNSNDSQNQTNINGEITEAEELVENANKNSNKNINVSNTNSSKPKEIKAYIVLIIDDLGNQGPESDLAKTLLGIKAPLTLSVIPERAKSQEVARAAKEKGFEVIIHQPMEPVNPSLSVGEGAILANMTDAQIAKTISKHISDIPEAVGMNNHMGSKVTQDAELMKAVMKQLKKKNLFFADSMTISTSKGFTIAKEEGVKTAKRSLFIDGKDDEAYIREQILELANTALEKRVIVPIGIGHIRSKTVAVIKEMIPELASMGVGLKKASEVVE